MNDECINFTNAFGLTLNKGPHIPVWIVYLFYYNWCEKLGNNSEKYSTFVRTWTKHTKSIPYSDKTRHFRAYKILGFPLYKVEDEIKARQLIASQKELNSSEFIIKEEYVIPKPKIETPLPVHSKFKKGIKNTNILPTHSKFKKGSKLRKSVITVDIVEINNKICDSCKLNKDITEYRKRNNICIDCRKDKDYKIKSNVILKNKDTWFDAMVAYKGSPTYYAKRELFHKDDYNKIQIYKLENHFKCIDCCEHLHIKEAFKYNNSVCIECMKFRRQCEWFEKIKADPLKKLANTLRSRLRSRLRSKKWKKSKRLNDYTGCSIRTLKFYLESKFLPGMTWNNHGEWHIDHIIPLSSAKTRAELYKLCHYSNLQPLWAKDNLQKSDKY